MENLWKKASNESVEYVDLFENSPTKMPVNVKRATEKSNTIANKHREAGNLLFGQKQWLNAIEEYNKSLCYAEVGSEPISLAYANRGNCFKRLGKYDECLADIELAKKSKYPERLMPKLVQRKADCLKMKSSDTKVGPTTATLSYAPKTTVPGMADCVEIHHNAEYGRHCVAKCDIPVGKTILVESSFVAITKRAEISHCATCQVANSNVMPCDKCTLAMFCSVECVECGRAYHDMECGYLFNDGILDCAPQFVARTIFMAIVACGSVDELMAFVESVRGEVAGIPTSLIEPKGRYRAFLQLKLGVYSEYERAAVRLQADYAYRYIVAMPTMADLFDTLVKQRFLMHLMLMHLILLGKNSSSGIKYDVNHVTSLGLVFSLFNHQCTPNLMNAGTGDKEVCITIRPIKKGEQLFITYVVNPKPNQRQYIFNEFGFWCECSKCVPVAVPMRDMLRMEMDGDNHAINSIIPFIHLEQDVAERERMKRHCISFINRHGHLPYNKTLEFCIYVFKQCILYEYGY